jgi:hypothetical protein
MSVARWLGLLCFLAAPLGAQQPAVGRFGDTTDGFAQYSGIRDSQRVVIRDSAAWQRYWADINRPFFPSPAIPTVDFSREIVLLAAMGTRPSGGFIIRIDSATVDSARLVVQVTQIVPGKGCAVPAVVTQPVDMVRIPNTSLPVAFAERVERIDCSPDSPPPAPFGTRSPLRDINGIMRVPEPLARRR